MSLGRFGFFRRRRFRLLLLFLLLLPLLPLIRLLLLLLPARSLCARENERIDRAQSSLALVVSSRVVARRVPSVRVVFVVPAGTRMNHASASSFDAPFALRAARCSGVSSFLPIARVDSRARRCAEENDERASMGIFFSARAFRVARAHVGARGARVACIASVVGVLCVNKSRSSTRYLSRRLVIR